MTDENNQTMRDEALGSVSNDRREELIERAHRFGAGHDPEDMGWHLVANTVAGREAAAEAAAAAQATKQTVDDLKQQDIPTKAANAVLGAADQAETQVEQKLEGFAGQQSESMKQAMRDVIQEEFDQAEKNRRQAWQDMLNNFDKKAGEIANKHANKMKSDLAATVKDVSKKDSVLSVLMWMMIGVLLMVGSGFGAVYAYNTFVQQTPSQSVVFKHCGPGTNGNSTWCRIKVGSR